MEEKIKLAHGAGGRLMDKFIKEKILKFFKFDFLMDIPLAALDDSAVVGDIVFTTDSHTVQPLFFPGGDIGSLAISGTVNDLAVMGAQPIALSSAFIIEEGFPMKKFEEILKSMSNFANIAKVAIATGDTKVVEKGALQEMVINTSGIGKESKFLKENFEEVSNYRHTKTKWLADSNLGEGDKIIISGNIGEHGVALISCREGYGFETKIKSDVAPINGLMENLLRIGGITSAKDPTRGGIANALNEMSEKSKVGIIIEEDKIPITDGVKSACDMLGIDALEIGNEGKVILGVVKEKAEDILHQLRKHPLGKNAEIIGEVTNDVEGVVLKTSIGGKRILDKPFGDPIPRIC